MKMMEYFFVEVVISQLGYSNEDDGTFFCRGCNKPMCQLGYSHEDDGTSYCRGCNKSMCQLGF